ncbi:hypothetical protein BX666DRAFT_1998620 [Dichotomocladium elegans]|nr:hypothetical protein BX666DRAFT_1998620 [Dichotomocladium elegans]
MTVENIVIIGGGYAGIAAAKDLEKRLARNAGYRILLIEKKDFFYHAVAAPRNVVENLDILFPYDRLFTYAKNRVVQASVLKLEPNKLHLDKDFEDSTEVPFKHAIIATGTQICEPFKLPMLSAADSKVYLAKTRQQIKAANSILIVGGGPVGIEMAGEIRGVFKDKKITLVHNQERLLLPIFSDRDRDGVLAKVKSLDIDVHLGETVVLPPDHSSPTFTPAAPIVTKSGKQFAKFDLVILAFGNRPNSGWLDKHLVSTEGFVKVKPTLQVDEAGFENVYAIGDVADIKEAKMAAFTIKHAAVVGANIASAIKGQKPSKCYTAGGPMMVITMGKKHGVALLPFGVFGDWFTTLVKGKSLFVEKYRAELNCAR